jgi:hypothetical protein
MGRGASPAALNTAARLVGFAAWSRQRGKPKMLRRYKRQLLLSRMIAPGWRPAGLERRGAEAMQGKPHHLSFSLSRPQRMSSKTSLLTTFTILRQQHTVTHRHQDTSEEALAADDPLGHHPVDLQLIISQVSVAAFVFAS